jgi:hypothetical protein
MNQRGPWRDFEREIRRRIDDEHDKCLCADLKIELFYKDEDLRPTKIQYDVHFTDGSEMHDTFPNIRGTFLDLLLDLLL